ncbi:hypothetical protein G6F23_015344 [Rhizopus arrhizus]|nr:hypothetical protein G6F23_015344 [Rhizopus arrhizus]
MAGAAYTWHDIDAKRDVAAGSLNQRLESSYRASSTQVFTELGYNLPRSLGEALDGLEQCGALQALLGERFCRAYISVKRKEYETFFRVISSWEREFLLLNV